MCQTPKVKTPAPPPPPPQEQDPSVTQAADDERRRRRAMASGRQSTILTGGEGVAGAGLGRRTLLGG